LAAVVHDAQLVPPLQYAPDPQLAQVAPQCTSVLQVVQTFALHHLPEPQSVSTAHSRHLPPEQGHVTSVDE
jgi:hypothetical protein